MGPPRRIGSHGFHQVVPLLAGAVVVLVIWGIVGQTGTSPQAELLEKVADLSAQNAKLRAALKDQRRRAAEQVDSGPAKRFAQNSLIPLSRDVAARNATLNGVTLMLLAATNDEYVGSSILHNGGPFGSETLSMFLQHIKPGTTVVDAGCNLGSYAAFFAAKVGRGGKVHCFEPQNKMAQLSAANAVVNGFSDIMTVHHVALSFAPGEVQMSGKLVDGSQEGANMADAESRHAPINYGGMNLGKGGEVAQAITLDSLGLTGISFIKVDVQGAEQLTLFGAQETIKTNMPVVSFEYTPELFNVTKEMIETMKIPQTVLQWDVMKFFAGLGYTKHNILVETLMLPPGYKGATK